MHQPWRGQKNHDQHKSPVSAHAPERNKKAALLDGFFRGIQVGFMRVSVVELIRIELTTS